MEKRKNKKVLIALILVLVLSLTGCDWAGLSSGINDFKGSLIGNNYDITFYDNYGEQFLTVKGDKIDITGNEIEETGYTSDGDITKNYTLSSVITITVDGSEIESCGDTVIFAGKGLEPVADFTLNDTIQSNNDGITSLTSIGRTLNKYKNYFGKKRVVVIKGQLGTPICAFEGDDVYWEIPDDLPKMTKLMIDNKPLYIHRANFKIIDSDLIE